MYEWFDRIGLSTDIDTLKREDSETGWLSLERWARARDWGVILGR